MACKIDTDTFGYPQISFDPVPGGGKSKDVRAFNALLEGVHKMLEKVIPALETENKVLIERIVELERRIAGMVVTVRAMNVAHTGEVSAEHALCDSSHNGIVDADDPPTRQQPPRKNKSRK